MNMHKEQKPEFEKQGKIISGDVNLNLQSAKKLRNRL